MNTANKRLPTSILTIKGWQIILLLFAIVIPIDLIDSFLNQLLTNFTAMGVSLDVFRLALIISYPCMVWNSLNRLLSSKAMYGRTGRKHLFTLIVVMIIAASIKISFTYQTTHYVAAAVFAVSWALICAAPAKQLKSIELKRNAGVWEYIPDAFLFFIWPLGVLWLQPRLNKMTGRRSVITK